jgi:LmeA-like phospholipid-binding
MCRMRGRAVRWLIISVIGLVVLLVVVDRVGAAVAERIAGDTLESSQHLRSRPEVDIAGFPFLTQLIGGDYDQITVTARDVPLGPRAHGLVLSWLQVVLHHLSVSSSFSHFHADTATATAIVDYGQLGRVLGVQLQYAGDGRVEVVKHLTFAGHTFNARVTARPALEGQSLHFTDTRVEGVAGVPDSIVASLVQIYGVRIPLESIPFDVQLRAVAAGSDGVSLSLAGRNLVYDK